MNEKVRAMAKEKGVYMWEIAKHIGISEATIMRWMREELSSEREKHIIEAISEIAVIRSK